MTGTLQTGVNAKRSWQDKNTGQKSGIKSGGDPQVFVQKGHGRIKMDKTKSGGTPQVQRDHGRIKKQNKNKQNKK